MRSRWTQALLGLSGMLLMTTVRAGLPEELARCRAVAEATARLACYDALAEPRAAAAPSAPAPVSKGTLPLADETAAGLSPPRALPVPQPQTAPTPPVAAPPGQEQTFGAEALASAKSEEQLTTLAAHAVGRFNGVHRGMIVKLDNGQLWKNVDDREYDDYEAENPAVVVERNFLGNYWLQFADARFRFRVRRIR